MAPAALREGLKASKPAKLLWDGCYLGHPMWSINRDVKRRILWSVAGIIGSALALYIGGVAYFALVPNAEDYAHRVEFDEVKWRERSLDAESDMWPTRLRMVDDLIADKRLDGLTKGQVASLLGPSDQTDKWNDWHVVYHLGPERRGMFRIDSEWLVIRFSASGQVSDYRLVAD